MRSSNGNHLKGTIIGNGMYKAWEDSPRSGAMTPAMLDKLRERKHERSWWLKRLQREYDPNHDVWEAKNLGST